MCRNCKQIATLKGGLWNSFESIARVYDSDGLSPTLTTCQGGGHHVKIMDDYSNIRRLTPKEYWRLMGFTDEDFEKAKAECSDAQLYKQAGNSVVVQVLEAVLKQLLETNEGVYEKDT